MKFWESENGLIKIHCADCLPAMREMEDKAFDLAICDPPYGKDAGNMVMGKGKDKKWEMGRNWDKEPPPEEYFTELSRVAKQQIVWGGNYFNLPITGGWIFWNKDRQKKVSFADGELAWTSFLKVLREAKVRYDGFVGADEIRIHPTQKPVALYHWLLTNYAKPGQTILDTHLGSGSIAIACHDMGYSLAGFEIDLDYFNAAVKRIENHIKQGRLF